MKKVLIYVRGEVVECWRTQAAFAKAKELLVGSIRNSICVKGYWRGKDGGILRYVEVQGEDTRKGNRFGKRGVLAAPFKKKVDEGDLPGF